MIWYVGNGLKACGLIAGLCLGIFIEHRQGRLFHPQHLEYIPQDLAGKFPAPDLSPDLRGRHDKSHPGFGICIIRLSDQEMEMCIRDR